MGLARLFVFAEKTLSKCMLLLLLLLQLIEDVEGFLQLEDEQFLCSDFKNAQSNLSVSITMCIKLSNVAVILK